MLNSMEYPRIVAARCTGSEPIKAPNGNTIGTLSDYWSWAHSDLIANAERGVFAEYLVACALGIQNNGVRKEWDKYDLLYKKDSVEIGIEVKSSAYIQTWEQSKPSSLIFGIRPTRGWDSESNKSDNIPRRQADIYVFCVHKEQDQSKVNPLDITQWDFYLLPTQILNEQLPEQKTISLSALKSIGAVKTPFDDLQARMVELIVGLKSGG